MASVAEALALALQFHQAGHFQQAERVYYQILQHNPYHADALHLLGLTAFQTGRHELAVRCIRQALDVNPTVAAFHSNLGLAYQALGHLDEAAACYQEALRIKPDYAAALTNLGNVLRAQGKPEEALTAYQRALQIVPGSADIHNNLGNAFFQQKKWDEAAASYREALRLQPDFGKASYNLANTLKEQGKLDEAVTCFQQARRQMPDSAEVENNLGDVLRELGRLEEARDCFTRAIRLNPKIAQAYSNMGQTFQEEMRLEEAVGWYQQALQHEPNAAVLHCNLACALVEQEHYDEALGHYEIALRLDPASAEAHYGLGFFLEEQDRLEEARDHYRTALRLKPTARAHSKLAKILQEFGAFEEAEASYRAALKQEPRNPEALAGLATMLRGKLPKEDLAALRRLLAGSDLTEAKRMLLHFGLAHVLDAQGSFAEAAEHLQKSNAQRLVELANRGKSFDPAKHIHFVDSLIATFTADFFGRVHGFGLETQRPVFIVGLPRSGTTLVEQVLASHSQVFGAGELSFLPETFQLVPRLMESTDPPIECLRRLDKATAQRLGEYYEERLRQRNDRAPRVTDKMPGNYLQLGLISTLFPRAKVVHCRRDLRDVALSCWMTNFRKLDWAYDPEHIASHFQQYQRLMRHWRKVLPLPVLDVVYEEMVADLEGVARRMVAWVGLEWEPACLAFHQTSRPVRTASVTQVRQPIYTRSAGRWKKYEKVLGDLFTRLKLDTDPS